MKPGVVAIVIFGASIIIYALFRNLLNQEVAAVALATLPGLLSIWLQRHQVEAEPSHGRPKCTTARFSNWQVAALFAFSVVAVWLMALLSLAAFNVGLGDLIQRELVSGSNEAFNHLQMYYIGLGVVFMWLPLLCVFGAYIGPRSLSAAYWPYLAGLIVILVAFVCVRFLFVSGSYQESMLLLQQAVNLDLGEVQGGRFIAIASTVAMFVVLLLLFSVLPWLVAFFRRRLFLNRSAG